MRMTGSLAYQPRTALTKRALICVVFFVVCVRTSSSNPFDVVLQPSRPNPGWPLIGTIVAYNRQGGFQRCQYTNLSFCEIPMYYPYDASTQRFYDNLVEELLYSRVNFAMVHTRGCYSLNPASSQYYSSNGDMCPHRLAQQFIPAMNAANATNLLKWCMFYDTGAVSGAVSNYFHYPAGKTGVFDFANTTHWPIMYNLSVQAWHDTVPRSMWFLPWGQPILTFWSISSGLNFANQNGHASKLLTWMTNMFKARYGVRPFYWLDQSWFSSDPTITTAIAQAANNWFNPALSYPTGTYTYRAYNGQTWGAVVPSYRNPGTAPGCGLACREQQREAGFAFNYSLSLGTRQRNINLTLIEGFVDEAESCGSYRSLNKAWPTPNTYLNIIRRYADPHCPTLRLQAEAPDTYFDSTTKNIGGFYRLDALDVGLLNGTGWFVGWTAVGEWLHWQVELLPGWYRITANVQALAAQTQLQLAIDGKTAATLSLPDPGCTASSSVCCNAKAVAMLPSCFGLQRFADVQLLSNGPHEFNVTFLTGNINLDWVFIKRVSAPAPAPCESCCCYCRCSLVAVASSSSSAVGGITTASSTGAAARASSTASSSLPSSTAANQQPLSSSSSSASPSPSVSSSSGSSSRARSSSTAPSASGSGESTSSSASPLSTPALVGIVAGGAVLLLLVCLLVFCCCRRRNAAKGGTAGSTGTQPTDAIMLA